MTTITVRDVVPCGRPFPDWAAYAAARDMNMRRIAGRLRRHLARDGRIKETLGTFIVMWPSQNAPGYGGEALADHLMVRMLGFGTTLELLEPDFSAT